MSPASPARFRCVTCAAGHLGAARRPHADRRRLPGERGCRGRRSRVPPTRSSIAAPDQRQLARDVFVRLTELGDGSAGTRRRRVPIEELGARGSVTGAVQALLQRLADARLVTSAMAPPRSRTRSCSGSGRRCGAGWRRTATACACTGRLGDAAPTRRRPTGSDVCSCERTRGSRGLLAGALALLLVAVLARAVALVQRGHAQAQALTSDAERVGAQALTEQNVDSSLLLGVTAVRLGPAGESTVPPRSSATRHRTSAHPPVRRSARPRSR